MHTLNCLSLLCLSLQVSTWNTKWVLDNIIHYEHHHPSKKKFYRSLLAEYYCIWVKKIYNFKTTSQYSATNHLLIHQLNYKEKSVNQIDDVRNDKKEKGEVITKVVSRVEMFQMLATTTEFNADSEGKC